MPKKRQSQNFDLNNDRESLIKTLNKLANRLSDDSIDGAYAETYLEEIEKLNNQFYDIHANIISLFPHDREEHESIKEEFHDLYLSSKCTAKRLINTNKFSKTDIKSISNIRLPEIQLPIFNGDYDTWISFRDSFISIIHENNSLTNIQKFHYLTGTLKGEAYQIIESIGISDINYNIAWELLLQRYEDSGATIEKHLEALFQIPKIQKESYSELRSLINEVQKHVRALKALKQPVDYWDTILIHLLIKKLDFHSARHWKTYKSDRQIEQPILLDFINCLELRCKIIEPSITNLSTNQVNKIQKSKFQSYHVNLKPDNCKLCNRDNHFLYRCKTFSNLSQDMRFKKVKELNYCINCLKHHPKTKCPSNNRCQICKKFHHTLLHKNSTSVSTPDNTSKNNSSDTNYETVTKVSSLNSQTLLSTIILKIADRQGNWHECRALLDTGSTANFITHDLIKKLQLNTQKINIPIIGISKSVNYVKENVTIPIKSKVSNFKTSLEFLVLDNITNNLPATSFDPKQINIPNNIKLSDNKFYESRPIDMLLGTNIVYQILGNKTISLTNNSLILKNTLFGWIITGTINQNLTNNNCHNSLNTHVVPDSITDVNNLLSKFWEIENVPIVQDPRYTNNQQLCEDKFVDTIRRSVNGNFIVNLPFNNNLENLGNSYLMACKRLHTLEHKLIKNKTIYSEYKNFMKEYINMGHMSEIDISKDSPDLKPNYIPHHSIIKESSTSTKLRVVFDGSAKTSSGLSLNDTLLVGPVVQDELFSILLRFRIYNYVINADIKMMYRMIEVDEKHRNKQRIVWRFNTNEPIKTYNLNTVTYGLASSPYLATRCLKQIAIENRNNYPKACDAIERDFYVDDLMSGASTIEEALLLRKQISYLLSNYGFNLRKWNSNSTDLLNDIQSENKDKEHLLNITDDTTIRKTLGLYWESSTDNLRYEFLKPSNTTISKRSILSTISKIFDPLGLIGPVSINAKIILQKLWKSKIQWDDPLPEDLQKIWTNYLQQFYYINKIQIPRHVVSKNYDHVELHAFSDASSIAYGACLYIKSRDINYKPICHLLCSKSRVAPLKQLTIPRLELCAAALSQELVHRTIKDLRIKVDQIHYWIDSTIVLAWLKRDPATLKTFVANRVQKIQNNSNISQWHHVKTTHNPADIISRGATPEFLNKSSIWWSGPSFILEEQENWPRSKTEEIEILPDIKKITLSHIVTNKPDDFTDLLTAKFSNLNKLIRVTAYVQRFIKNCRNLNKNVGTLSKSELDNSLITLISLVQISSFQNEIKVLKNYKTIPTNSNLISLTPFLDSDNILRVGGRLKNAYFLNYANKHPILLPGKHPLTKLIIINEHNRLLHAGLETTLASIRQRYWPISGRTVTKQLLRNCIKCFRSQPRYQQPIMGNLPRHRLSQSRPFKVCGTDFAGPFMISNGVRGRKNKKAYLCIFICFATKAVHLEVTTELTTDSFMSALNRFMSRRGISSDIYSDNGRNYVGANNLLKELYKFLKNNHSDIFNQLANKQINWHFSPALAPSFGGLWESTIKSIKRIFFKIFGNLTLTLEQFNTALIQIEAVINSRPITPVSSDPNDLNALTPGHFLIGEQLTSIPTPDSANSPMSKLKHYRHLIRLKEHFWKRWSTQYITSLQQRRKWQHGQSDVSVSDMVLIRDDHSPSFEWKIGRIVQVHPDESGVVRVVTIKSPNGTLKRAINKICILPKDNDDL